MAELEITELGPLVRLAGISISQLPTGGRATKTESSTSGSGPTNESSASADQSDLKTFIANVLQEAIPFIDDVKPKYGIPQKYTSAWKSKGTPKKFPTSNARVELTTRTVPATDLFDIKGLKPTKYAIKDEFWACRRSCHKNEKAKGTADWYEFVDSFKKDHAKSEKAFTPTCIGARPAITWDAKGIEVEVRGFLWKDATVSVVEMSHKMPMPGGLLKDRNFPVLQVTASQDGTDEFIVVSIPLSDFELSPHAIDAKNKNMVIGTYVAVERIRIMKNGEQNGEIEWIMATASDAKGVLPQWIQNLAVPNAIAEDVELFISWKAGQRSQAEDDPVSKPEPQSRLGGPEDSAMP